MIRASTIMKKARQVGDKLDRKLESYIQEVIQPLEKQRSQGRPRYSKCRRKIASIIESLDLRFFVWQVDQERTSTKD